MIITCPNCQTKYQVTYEAIGSVGRKVQCASCQQSWQQRPPPPMVEPESDQLFDEIAEDALDEALQAEQRDVAQQEAEEQRTRRLAEKSPEPEKKKKTTDAAELRKRQQAFSRRQTAMFSSLPMARMRRTARIGASVLLACIVGLGFFGRVEIVERYPDLAGLYSAVGLGVNVVGLDLAQLQSNRSVAEGKEALAVSAQIVGVMPDPVAVPPVLVSLLDAEDRTVYEWIVSPRVRDLMAGERATFDTRLSLPPSEAVRVRLSFTNGKAARGSANEPNQAGPREDTPAPHHGPAVSAQPQIPAH